MRRTPLRLLALAMVVATPLAVSSVARSAVGRQSVQVVHGPSLETTVTGEDPDRNVAVYLPPSYATSPDRRYPVLFLLHGIGGTDRDWSPAAGDPVDRFGTTERLMNEGIASGRLAEMIVVMPDQMTRAGGSFYTNSTVTGRWEDFTVRDLLTWVDGTYRTLPRAESRGIAGHSMGGYGAIMIGMKYPDVFSVVYGMNPAVLGWGGDLTADNPAFRNVLERHGWKELQGLWENGIICASQAFSPNPHKAPFFADVPFVMTNGKLAPNGAPHEAWEGRFPILLAPRYRDNLLKLRGLRFDSGTGDEFTHIPVTSRELSRVLTDLGVSHVFEEYNGDHRNRLWGQTGRMYTEVLPWFSLLLKKDEGSTRPASMAGDGVEDRTTLDFSFSYRPGSSTQSVFLLGNLDELGGDEVTRAIPMQSDDSLRWRLSVSVPADREITYGYWVRDHRDTGIEDPQNGTRISEEKTIRQHREPRPDGKALLLHSTFDDPILHWRQDNGDYNQLVLKKVGNGRLEGEHRWKAHGFGLASRNLQFFITDREQTVREPLEGAYETPLERMFLQDQELFTYLPEPSVSPMRRDYGPQPRSLESEALGQVRQYTVMLPRGYDEQTSRHYPVAYFYDGQILWDPVGSFIPWDRDGERMAGLVGSGEVGEMILVGMISDLTRRLAEVTPPEDMVYGTNTPGQADAVMKFLTMELKPLIDSTYRTRPGQNDTYMAGFSGGGLLAMLAGWEYHGIFGAVALQSAGLGAAPNFNTRILRDPRPPFRIYFDVGTQDGKDPAGNAFFELSQRVWNDFLGDAPPGILEKDIRVHLGLGHTHQFHDAGQRIQPLMTFLHPATLERDEELWALTQ